MDEKQIKEFWNIANILETTLLALKYQNTKGDDVFTFDTMISCLDFGIKNLKRYGVNNIGFIE